MIGIENRTSTRTAQNNQIDNSNYNSIVIADQKSVVSGNSANISEKEMTAIDNFVSYCNSGNLEKAYNLSLYDQFPEGKKRRP